MVDVEFALVGEPLILDLVNTRPSTPAGPVDLLATPAGLRAWLAVEADRLAVRAVLDRPGVGRDVAEALPTADDLATVHAIRDHAARALDRARHGRQPAPVDVRGLNAAMRAAPAYRELHRTDTGDETGIVTSTLRREGPLGTRLAAVLAEAAAELLAYPTVSAVRACQAQDCTLLFLPAHPRRLWCSATRCGNRARVARYYQRHKAT
jgi:predicted RNA-binding Zn ribbon-like protein